MDLTALGFRQPIDTEQYDVAHQNFNWGRADPLLGAQSYTSTTRPSTNLFIGRLIWETDTLRLMRYNGSGWDQVGGAAVGSEVIGEVTADQSRTSTTTLSLTTGLSMAVVANARYSMEGFIAYAGVAAADMKFTVAGPAGATAVWTPGGSPASSASQVGDIDMGTVGLGVSLVAGCNTQDSALQLKGRISIAATAGTVQFQHAQNAANATPTIVRAGSWISLKRIA